MRRDKGKDNNGSKRKVVIWGLILFTIFFNVAMYFIKLNLFTRSVGVLWDESRIKTYDASYISISGFSEVYFEADKKSQDFSFHNPQSNRCNMNVELTLPDGRQLFLYEGIKPGYGLNHVDLSESLSVGDYKDCKFVIKCYSKSGEQYNGAVLTVNLHVR